MTTTGKHSAHIQLPAIVHGNQSDGGCPPLLGVVPQQDVGDCNDDEGLGGVTQPTQQPVDGAEQDVAPAGRNGGVGMLRSCPVLPPPCLPKAGTYKGCWVPSSCAALPVSTGDLKSYTTHICC